MSSKHTIIRSIDLASVLRDEIETESEKKELDQIPQHPLTAKFSIIKDNNSTINSQLLKIEALDYNINEKLEDLTTFQKSLKFEDIDLLIIKQEEELMINEKSEDKSQHFEKHLEDLNNQSEDQRKDHQSYIESLQNQSKVTKHCNFLLESKKQSKNVTKRMKLEEDHKLYLSHPNFNQNSSNKLQTSRFKDNSNINEYDNNNQDNPCLNSSQYEETFIINEIQQQKSLPCIFCDKKFNKNDQLVAHYKTHKKFENMKCRSCNKEVCVNLQYLLKNYKMREFRCVKCTNSKNQIIKKTHEITKVSKSRQIADLQKDTLKLRDLKICCDICGIEVGSNVRMFWHRKAHLESQHFKCPVCRNDFTTRDAMIEHCKDVHSKSNKVQCDICNKEFYNVDLKTHMKTHQDLKIGS